MHEQSVTFITLNDSDRGTAFNDKGSRHNIESKVPDSLSRVVSATKYSGIGYDPSDTSFEMRSPPYNLVVLTRFIIS